MKRILLKFENGEEITASMLEEKAPYTCGKIWNSLPLESVVTQSRWSGREVNFAYTEKDMPPRENQTIFTSVGEVCYWRDWNWEGEGDHPQAIAIYYGAEMARSHRGHEPVNVFAQVDYHELEGLVQIGERVWLEGKHKIFIERIDE
ncbi:DUF3830 family protein [Cytobacillus oceanisediminis]|uniref:DUF3830 family protein n=1 Tax=Cytobacillus oceanisediminis TaxID=665099 RepID=UPI003735A556